MVVNVYIGTTENVPNKAVSSLKLATLDREVLELRITDRDAPLYCLYVLFEEY